MNLAIPHEEGRGVARYLDMEVREITEGEGPVRLVGTAHPSPAVLDQSGRMHMGVLGTMCDAIGGFCGGLGALPDGWVVTTNMMLRAADRPVGAAISLESEVLRAGRTAVVTNVHAHDEQGFVVGGIVRSAVLVPEGGPPPFARIRRDSIWPDAANSSCPSTPGSTRARFPTVWRAEWRSSYATTSATRGGSCTVASRARSSTPRRAMHWT